MDEQTADLLGKISSFLENERELYGPFSIKHTSVSHFFSAEDECDPNTPKKQKSETFAQPDTGPLESNHTAEQQTLREKLDLCTTLEELRMLCTQASDLYTDLNNTNLVFGTGNPDADLMLIGEAPGEQEDLQCEPFVGAAGQLLNKILSAIHFRREDVYIANILKHRPPGNRNPTPDERMRSLPYLLKQIELVNPRIILCLGKVSGTTLLNTEESLNKLRGHFYPFMGAELTVTYHPAALLRNPKWKRPTWEDVQRVRKRYDERGGRP